MNQGLLKLMEREYLKLIYFILVGKLTNLGVAYEVVKIFLNELLGSLNVLLGRIRAIFLCGKLVPKLGFRYL